MSTLSNEPAPNQRSQNHQAKVARAALTVAAGSAGGLALLLGAAAWGALSPGLVYLAIATFGSIVVVALVATIHIIRQ